MRSTDLFTEQFDPTNPWGSRTVLNTGLVESVRLGTQSASDLDAASGLLDLVQDELEAFGTSGGEQLTDSQMELAIRALEAVTTRLGLPLGLPFRNFTSFRSYWHRKDARNSWQARRNIIEELMSPTRKRINKLQDEPLLASLNEDSIADLRDPSAIREQIDRIQRAIINDPALMIGSAKELVESTAKAVLLERGLEVDEGDDLPALVNKSQAALGLHPSRFQPCPDGTDAIKKILGALITLTAGLAELRNRGYGTGHGASGERVGLRPRHGYLAVNAATTWCRLMLDALADPWAPWRMPPSDKA